MKKFFIVLVLLVLVGFVVYLVNSLYFNNKKTPLEKLSTESTIKKTMKISSGAFENNQLIPSRYTCDGSGINPPFSFSGIPVGTKSLVLIVDDPDAPGGTWVHWVVYNILSTTTEMAEDTVPANGIQAITSSGKASYGSPCPPSGTHRYFFKLYALDNILPVDPTIEKKTIENNMQGHILDQAQLIGIYSRKYSNSSFDEQNTN